MGKQFNKSVKKEINAKQIPKCVYETIIKHIGSSAIDTIKQWEQTNPEFQRRVDKNVIAKTKK